MFASPKFTGIYSGISAGGAAPERQIVPAEHPASPQWPAGTKREAERLWVLWGSRCACCIGTSWNARSCWGAPLGRALAAVWQQQGCDTHITLPLGARRALLSEAHEHVASAGLQETKSKAAVRESAGVQAWASLYLKPPTSDIKYNITLQVMCTFQHPSSFTEV